MKKKLIITAVTALLGVCVYADGTSAPPAYATPPSQPTYAPSPQPSPYATSPQSPTYATSPQQPTLASSPQPLTSSDNAGRFGAGVILGEPTGLSLKYWLNDTLAIDGAAGWSYADHTDFYLHSDVLWHKFDLLTVPQGSLPLYFGVGGLVRFRDDGRDNQVGIRAPVGLSYIFDRIPVDIFVEIAPAIVVAPSVRADITGGIGVRYWF